MSGAGARFRSWNAVRFEPGAGRPHVESYFLKLNDPAGRRALWLKATILARTGAPPVAEAWAIAFERGRAPVAAKRVVPYAEARFAGEGLGITCAGLQLDDGSTQGALEGAHAIDWQLAFEGAEAPFVLLPPRLYDERLPSSKLVTPHPDLSFRGSYRVDGRPVEVDGWAGMQGHNWGRRHPLGYAWVHCNLWEEVEGLVLEGITARVALGPLASPPLTLIAVQHGGDRHFFVPPASLWSARGRVGPRSLELRAASSGARLRARFRADTADFAGLLYENPAGAPISCLNSKIAEGEITLELPGRRPLEARTRVAALEIGTRDPDHGVAMLA